MANFYATYSAASASGAVVTANQGTSPWVVTGSGTAGASAPGVVTVQGITSGTPIPISGSITATNPSVGATGAAVPASGTYVAANVAGNLVGLVATANGLKVDGTATVQPISATSLPLPTGASTAAKQPALGTAGTASADVITVQGITSMTPLLVNGSGSTQPVSGTVTANAGTGTFTVGGTVTANAGTGTFGVSGTVTANAGTGTFTTATAVATATFQDGSIAFGSLTTSYQTVVTAGGVLKHVDMRNNTNAVIVVSLNSGSTTSYTLDSGDMVSLDLAINGSSIATSTTLQAKYSGSAPTSGSIRINCFY